jgi:hypothetical protein
VSRLSATAADGSARPPDALGSAVGETLAPGAHDVYRELGLGVEQAL